MVVLDIAVVNVALPSIQTDLGFSQENLQWVISAYALFFGGFLLLGGRAADLLGRRRVFLVGIVVFTVASLLSGLAWSEGSLIVSRALQGLGAAIISPAALSILTTPFAEGRERNTALGAWGARRRVRRRRRRAARRRPHRPAQLAVDLLRQRPGRRRRLPARPRCCSSESRDAAARSFDLPGAALVTGGLVVLVYAITQANQYGWGSAETVGLFAAAARCWSASWPGRRARATRSCRCRSSACARSSARTSPG